MRIGIALISTGLLVFLISSCGGGGSNKGDGGSDGGGCTVLELRAVEGEPYTNSDSCAGVLENQIIYDADDLAAHFDAYCDSVVACSGSDCGFAMGFMSVWMMVYVAGTASGCDANATIEEVRVCEEEVQVDYRIEGEGLCGTVVNAWAATLVDESDLPVVFKRLE